MKETTFKNILHSYVVTFILTLVKTIIYPYSFAPDELAKAITLYDETQPMASVFEIMFLFLIVSLIRSHKFYTKNIHVVISKIKNRLKKSSKKISPTNSYLLLRQLEKK